MTPPQFATLNPSLTTALCQDLPAGTSVCLAAPTVRFRDGVGSGSGSWPGQGQGQ